MNKRIDLATLARAKALARKKRIALRKIEPSAKAERIYRRVLRQLVLEAAKATRDTVLPAATQAIDQDDQSSSTGVESALDQVRTVLIQVTPPVQQAAAQLLGDVASQHREDWIKAVKSATGVDLSGALQDEDLADEFALMVRRNASLIRSLSDDVYHRVERTVTQAVLDGTRPKELARTLTEQFGIMGRRANLIARDQIGKATGDLNRLRQEQARIEKYRWSTSLDERVRGNPAGLYPKARPSHWAREGKIFRWDDPPSDGHPGHPVNCRCVAIAVLDLD